MVEVSEQSHGNVLLLKAAGKLTHQDYQEVIIPRVESIVRQHGKARLLMELGDQFQGWEPKALWDDLRFGLGHRKEFEKMGVVGAPRWFDWVLKLGAVVMGRALRSFAPAQREEALQWVTA